MDQDKIHSSNKGENPTNDLRHIEIISKGDISKEEAIAKVIAEEPSIKTMTTIVSDGTLGIKSGEGKKKK